MIERIYNPSEKVEFSLKIEKVKGVVEISGPASVSEFLNKYKELPREVGVVLHLDMNFEAKFVQQVCIGSKQSCSFNTTDIFKSAIVNESDAIILVHNHPQERNARPTAEDTDITRRLRAVGLEAKLPLVDHLVFGTEKYYSYREKGVIFPQGGIYIEEIGSLSVGKHKKAKSDLLKMVGRIDRDFIMR